MVSRAWWLLALMGCGDDALTELVLSADSNVALDQITFEVSADGVPMRTASAARSGKGASFVSIVREDAPLGPITVVARGLLQSRELLHRTHVVQFVEGESLLVRLDLYQRCVSAQCNSGQTCGADGCTAEKLDQLPAWSGSAPGIGVEDAGAAPNDAGSDENDAAALTQCGSSMVDLTSDQNHCGTCDKFCWLWQNCEAGACVLK